MTRSSTTNLRSNDAECWVEQLSDATKRSTAMERLSAIGADAVPALAAGLLDGRWQVRKGAAMLLTQQGDGTSFEALLPLLRDSKASVRLWGMHALAAECSRDVSKVPVFVPLLIERIELDRSPRVRGTAAWLLATHPLDARSEAVFRNLLGEEDGKLRALARHLLEQSRSRP